MEKKITEKISDKTTEVFDQINSKIKNPFVFSYLISFTLLNWKPISVFVRSDYDIYETINCIENPSYDYSFWSTFWFSLLVAVIYTVVIPFMDYFNDLAKDATEMWKYKNTKRKIEIGQKKKEVDLKIEGFENELQVIADNQKLKIEQADLIKIIDKKEEKLIELDNELEDAINAKVKLEIENNDQKQSAKDEIVKLTKEKELTNSRLKDQVNNLTDRLAKLKNIDDYTVDDIKSFNIDFQQKSQIQNYMEEFKALTNKLLPRTNPNNSRFKMPRKYIKDDLFKAFYLGDNKKFKLTKRGLYFWIKLNQPGVNITITDWE